MSGAAVSRAARAPRAKGRARERVSAVPVRTCIGCREARRKDLLVRFVRSAEGMVAMDPDGTSPGRGAYLCPDPACFERVVRGGRFAHAFRKPCSAGANLAEEVRRLWPRPRSR